MKKLAKIVVFLLCACLITTCFTACGANDEKEALELISGAWVDNSVGEGYYFDTENMVLYEIENRVVQSSKSTEFKFVRKKSRDSVVIYTFVYYDDIEFELHVSKKSKDEKYGKSLFILSYAIYHDDSIKL